MAEVNEQRVLTSIFGSVLLLFLLGALAYILFPKEYFYGKIIYKNKTVHGPYLVVVYNFPKVYRVTSSDDSLEVLPEGSCVVMKGYKDPGWGVVDGPGELRNPKEYFRARVVLPISCEIK